MCTILCLMPTVARRGNAIPVQGTGVTVGCELSSEYWESNLGPLPEQPLITEPSFQPPPLTIFRQFQDHLLFKYILIMWLKQIIIVDFCLLPCVKNTWSGREWNRNRSKFLLLSSYTPDPEPTLPFSDHMAPSGIPYVFGYCAIRKSFVVIWFVFNIQVNSNFWSVEAKIFRLCQILWVRSVLRCPVITNLLKYSSLFTLS